ncbi:MAG: carboxymuconolactone decarboxylase family protein [Myxococcota bacterium]
MKFRRVAVAVVAVMLGSGWAWAQARPQPKPSIAPATTQKAFQEMQKTLGLVPRMFQVLPENAVPGAWRDFQTVELSNKTALSPKYKELIGLAVAAQVPCDYCTYFHTEAAKANGATSRELNEALTIGALVRKWSTVLNGVQLDVATFRKETQQMLSAAPKELGRGGAPPEVTDAQSAYKDMELTWGMVPSFMRAYPQAGVAGAWQVMKDFEMNPNTALPQKYKELIGLGVAAQIPCDYCTYFHTEGAKKQGATPQEISEAVAVASHTRFWSTILNGAQVDETAFRKETNQILQHQKRQAATPGKPSTGQR